ncbi:hypothetical protein [Caldibacillus thermoamylovorans]|uniref:hypothetical protein n=1 Tax=Caldibacillus thermoamylovorans TaxID=35841 RepID=UPI00203D2420|nr:hypothetical protein [Caldibacillus thermoamylovorans]MCM3478842.1 hypothetical protein [Caldibacillus thermoamylovorans]
MTTSRGSSPKIRIFHLKVATGLAFVTKIVQFSLQNGDEIEARRQNWAVFTSKWRRERVSSSKSGVFHLKMVTRMDLVAKK